MDADALSIQGLVSQLELSVEQNLANLGHNDVGSLEARLRELLRGVRARSNALAPINSLPPEMLAAIFTTVVSSCARPFEFTDPDDIRVINHPDLKKVDMRPQFRLAHVCRLWRSAALGDAFLWSHVDVAYPEAAVEFLLRSSAGCPLTLYASAEKASFVDRIMQDHGTRVCAVYLKRKAPGSGPGTAGYVVRQQVNAIINGVLGPQAVAPLFGLQAGAPPLNNPAAAFFNLPPAAPLNPAIPAFPPLGAPPFGLPAMPLFPGAPALQAGPAGLVPPGAAAFNAAPFQLGQAQVLPGAQVGVEETSGSIFEYFCSKAHQLECFTLREFKHRSVPSFGLKQASHSQPPESPLKALALILAKRFIPADSFPNLTHLYLSSPLKEPQTHESTTSLFQMLSRTPRLQFLQLSNLRAVAAVPNDFMIPLPQVSLDQLRLLVFCDVQLEVAFNMLKYLSLPDPVLLSIGGDEGIRGWQGNNLPPPLRLPPVAQFNAFTFMEISVDLHRLLLTGYDAQLTSGFVLKTHDYGQFYSTVWLPELPRMISLSRITVLHINDNDGRVLPHLLPYFTELEELSILLLRTIQREAGVRQTAATLFSSLTPFTTLVCPALRFLGLEAGMVHTYFPYMQLQAMVAGRHQRGRPLHRFVYQWYGAARLWSTAEAKEREQISLVEAKLSPLLQPYVDSIEYRLSSATEKVCPFVPRECWRAEIPDAEKYWRGERPSYGMPWEKAWHGKGDPVRQRLGEPQDGNHDEPASESQMRLEDFQFELGLLTELQG